MKAIELPGYQLETLSRDGELVLLRAVPERREPSLPALLLLTAAAERPAPASVAQLEHIRTLRDRFDPAWAVRPRAIEHHNGRPLLLLDDPGGELLAHLVGKSWAVDAFLRLAIGATVALRHLHERGLVHKDLKPVSGYAGIGKSTVVNELHRALISSRGLFASGKFDEYKRDIPYSALAQAFGGLIRQILSKSDMEVSRWRAELQDALGPSGQILVNLVPELELMIGKQPPALELSPHDAHNRFRLVFRRFLGVFARPEHPLALFLDDLQWSDAVYERIAMWARSCPQTFGHRAALVGAEIARLEGRVLDAEHLYEEAIRLAREDGFVQNEAMAREVASRFYAARKMSTIAKLYLGNARDCSLRWGALGKVAELDQHHPDLGAQRANSAPTSSIGATVGQLDVAAVVEMSQAVSGEIVLERLIEKLMVVAVEHAGATRGLLILPHGEGHRIEADATTRHEAVIVRYGPTAVSSLELPESVLRFVMRAHESVLLDDALVSSEYSADPYVVRSRARSVLCLPLVRQAKLIGVLYLENNLTPHAFTRDRIAILELLASQAAISLENARLYADLQESDTYLAEAQRLSHTGSFGWNVETGELRWSDETFQIYGFDRKLKPTIELLAQRTHPEDRASTTERLQSAVRHAQDWELEYRLLMPDGAIKNIRLVARAVRENAAELSYVGAIMDITDARRAEERLQTSLSEKQALLKEVHHRVKNNLQLISSLLSLQAGRSKDPAVGELFADSRNRVRSMALVHENLYRAGDFGKVSMAPHIQTLCAHLTRVYAIRDRAIELSLQIGDCQMDLDRAVSCGLLVNELVSNALKHAFPGGRPGRVRVELTSLAGGGHQLVVSDDGVGLAADVAVTRGKSLGLQLVDDLTRQLRGQLAVNRSGGTSFAIVLSPDSSVGAES